MQLGARCIWPVVRPPPPSTPRTLPLSRTTFCFQEPLPLTLVPLLCLALARKDLTYRDVTAMVTSFSPLGPTEAQGLPVGPGRGVFNQLTRAWTGRLRGVARGPGAKAWPRSRLFLELRFFIPERDGDRVWPRNRGLVTGTSWLLPEKGGLVTKTVALVKLWQYRQILDLETRVAFLGSVQLLRRNTSPREADSGCRGPHTDSVASWTGLRPGPVARPPSSTLKDV